MNGKEHKDMADQLLASEHTEDEEEPVGNKNVVAQPDGSDRGTTSTSENVRKTIFGLVIVVGIAFSGVGATQFSQSTYTSDVPIPVRRRCTKSIRILMRRSPSSPTGPQYPLFHLASHAIPVFSDGPRETPGANPV